MEHSVEHFTLDGFGAVRLSAPGGLDATFVPSANMLLASLQHGAQELLVQRQGLHDYAEHGSTMGVPLLYPWANRLAELHYEAAGVTVMLDRDSPLIQLDEHGLPIHGVLPKLLAWELRDTGADDKSAWLRATLDFSPKTPAFEVFPFPHSLQYLARLAADSLRIEVRLTPTGKRTVPVSFGFHPYLRLGGSRPEAIVRLPVRRRLRLDRRMIPNGQSEAFSPGKVRLGTRGWDDAFTELETPPRFELNLDTRKLSLTFGDGYRFAQVFSPPEADYVCFEPMTSPTNALLSGPPGLSLVKPGQAVPGRV